MTTDEILWEEIQKATIFDWMERKGVDMLTVRFNGEGDSGSFENYVEIDFQDSSEIDNAAYDLLQTELRETPVSTMTPTHSRMATLEGLILQLSERIEESCSHGIDWYNNDGGEGKVEWILDGIGEDGLRYKRGVCLTVSQRVVETDTETFSVFGVVEDEE